MSFASLLHFGGAAVSQGADALQQSVASSFPTIWSRAAHDQLNHSLDQLRAQVVEADTRLKAAQKKVADDKQTIAEIDEQLAGGYSKAAYDAANDTDKPDIKAMAVKLRTEHTKLDSLLAHDQEAIASAMTHMTQVQSAYDTFNAHLEEFDAKKQEAQDHLADSKNREREAELELQSTAQLSAITSGASALTSMMGGLNAAADAAEERAKIAEMKVQEAHSRAGTSVQDLLAAAKAGKTIAVSTDPWA